MAIVIIMSIDTDFTKMHSFKGQKSDGLHCEHWLNTVTLVETKWLEFRTGRLKDESLAFETCPNPVCSCFKNRMRVY